MRKKKKFDYSLINSAQSEPLISSVKKAAETVVKSERTHRKKTFRFIGVAYDMALRLNDSREDWEAFCNWDRWTESRIKPKIDAKLEEVCRFVAYAVFSDVERTNDDRAGKYGRAMGYMARMNKKPAGVARYLERKTLEGVIGAAREAMPLRAGKQPTVVHLETDHPEFMELMNLEVGESCVVEIERIEGPNDKKILRAIKIVHQIP